ncbi:hypothetical protein [Glacieibacterium frigidum]|uniref:hypothetical protein n=1 Tax=Glacieibacterium frigidum TaxID=2593303 RepID=UPI00163DC7DE|nr:hypothetical protein [Glacieibacterium frigidum]
MSPRRGMGRGRIAALVAGLLVLLTLVLAIDLSPALPPAAAPTATQVREGRDALRRLRTAMRAPSPSATVDFSADDLTGIAALIGDVAGLRRVGAGIAGGRARMAASLDLPLGLWLNLSVATVPASPPGFPPLDVAVGDLGIPRWLTRAGIGAVRGVLVLRGGRLPPLDRIVLGTAVGERTVAFRLGTPLNATGVVRQFVGLGSAPVDGARVASLYCAMVKPQPGKPDLTLASAVRRGVAAAPPDAEPAAENRALLVALAVLTVGDRATDLAEGAREQLQRCRRAPPGLTLAGRADLAKHWSLSAALGATVGNDVTGAMGKWKELSDSLPGGSGFSFVDLAADRAGLRIGRAAGRPAQAEAIRKALAGASDAALLPLAVTGLREGMTNDEFVAAYGSLDTRDFDGAVRRIDALLDRDPVLRAAR